MTTTTIQQRTKVNHTNQQNNKNLRLRIIHSNLTSLISIQSNNPRFSNNKNKTTLNSYLGSNAATNLSLVLTIFSTSTPKQTRKKSRSLYSTYLHSTPRHNPQSNYQSLTFVVLLISDKNRFSSKGGRALQFSNQYQCSTSRS